MASIANTKISSLDAPWAGELTSGKHHYITDKPESDGCFIPKVSASSF